MNVKRNLRDITLSVVIAGSITAGLGGIAIARAGAQPAQFCVATVDQNGEAWLNQCRPTTDYGDDNGDGVVEEDESGWNCLTMGNRQCSLRVIVE